MKRVRQRVTNSRFVCFGDFDKLSSNLFRSLVDGEPHFVRVATWRVNYDETLRIYRTHNFRESFLYRDLISFSVIP